MWVTWSIKALSKDARWGTQASKDKISKNSQKNFYYDSKASYHKRLAFYL